MKKIISTLPLLLISIYLFAQSGIKFHTTLDSHSKDVFITNFSEDGQFLSTCSRDKTVKIYKIIDATFKLIETIKFDEHIYSISFSPDNNFLAVGSDYVEIYSKNDDKFELIKTFEYYEKEISFVKFSPNGRFFLFSSNKEIKIYEIIDKNFKCIKTISLGRGQIFSIDFSSNSKFLVLSHNNLIDIYKLLLPLKKIVTEYVNDDMAVWLKKDDFKSTEYYFKRTYNDKIDNRRDSLTQKKLSEKLLPILDSEILSAKYDSDSETVKIDFDFFPNIYVSVPRSEAELFCNNIKKAIFRDALFALTGEYSAAIISANIFMPATGKNYIFKNTNRYIFKRKKVKPEYEIIVIEIDRGELTIKDIVLTAHIDTRKMIQRNTKPRKIIENKFEVCMLLTSENEIDSIFINNQKMSIDSSNNDSIFTNAWIDNDDSIFVVRAIDKRGNSVRKKFSITNYPAPKNLLGIGKNYVLMIPISEYEHDSIPDLENKPIEDAERLKNVLIKDYNFKEKNIMLLSNPTREDIIDKFNELERIITEKDNLLIFYAGHGTYDQENAIGYWLPSDADNKKTSKYIYYSQLRDDIQKINSLHTLLVNDACYSGGIFRNINKQNSGNSINAKKNKSSTEYKESHLSIYIKKKYAKKSRQALTSAELKPVPNESVFFEYFINALIRNKRPYLSASDLFNEINEDVTSKTNNMPQLRVINDTGDQNGEFIFVRNINN